MPPRHAPQRQYRVQGERLPTPEALRKLERGLAIQGRKTLPCRARVLEPQPEISPRDPPIRYRKTVPTQWIALEFIEGKNPHVPPLPPPLSHPTFPPHP